MAGYGMDFRKNGKNKNNKNRQLAITRRLEIQTNGKGGNGPANSKKRDDELRKRTNRNKSVGGY